MVYKKYNSCQTMLLEMILLHLIDKKYLVDCEANKARECECEKRHADVLHWKLLSRAEN